MWVRNGNKARGEGERRIFEDRARAARNASNRAKASFDLLLKERDPTTVYNGIASTLFRYLEDRFSRGLRGLTRSELAMALNDVGVDSQIIEKLLEELEAADFARFAGTGDAKDLKIGIGRAQNIVDGIESSLT